MMLPAWLGVADALVGAMAEGHKGALRDMYEVRGAGGALGGTM